MPLLNHGLVFCPAFAKWVDSDVSAFASKQDGPPQFSTPKPSLWNLSSDLGENIQIDLEWLNTLDRGTGSNAASTFFGNLTQQCFYSAYDYMQGVKLLIPDTGCMSAALAVGIAEGLSKLPLRFGQRWLMEINSIKCLLDPDDPNDSNAENCYSTSPTHVDDATQLSNLTRVFIDISHDVYAYEFQGTTIYLAFAVLLLHVATVTVHLCIILFGERWSSSAWSSLGELWPWLNNPRPPIVLKIPQGY